MVDGSAASTASASPVCVGSGFVALDVVIGHEAKAPIHLWAGGSCGNVTAILAYLGWDAHPAARLGQDAAAQELVADLAVWGVHADLLHRDAEMSTPMIVERLSRQGGQARHTFEWTCPCCGAWLPRYKALRLVDIPRVVQRVPKCDVFYFDRTAPSSVQLAKHYRESGALVVFEPSSVRDPRLFREALALADVVKYSNERLGDSEEVADFRGASLQIETLGQEGLRYRRGVNQRWRHLAGFPVTPVRDSVGSGDWCTAGLIYKLIGHAPATVTTADEALLDEALRFGQALAAINCCFEGARGAMYALDRTQYLAAVGRLCSSGVADQPEYPGEAQGTGVLRGLCPSCEDTEVVRWLLDVPRGSEAAAAVVAD